ncbi:MAG: hypothetical protein U9Q97_09475 [Acidobacteriota bacterium]|nr:hypothetical protein [Acidobacteriota bacterium]
MISGKTLIAILTLILCAASFNTEAAEKANDQAASITAFPDALNLSIEEIINRREFTWRMPRERLEEKDEDYSGPFAMVVKWIGDLLGKGLKAVNGLIKKIIDWLIELFPNKEPGTDPSNTDWIYSVRLFLVILLALLGLILGYLFFRIWQKRHSTMVKAVIEPVIPAPDLEDDGVRADDLPASRWLNLAKEFAAKGSLRLAMRALYLAILSHLAEQEMITIEIFKSNLDYETELKRRAYEKEEILAAFSQTVIFFDRVWYGMHKITMPDLNSFAATQERIMALADQ